MQPFRARTVTALAVAALTIPVATFAQRSIVNFDEADLAATKAAVAAGSYAGLSWNPDSRWAIGSFGTATTCHSNPYCASPNGLLGTLGFAEFGFAAPTVFEGVWLAGLDPTRSAPSPVTLFFELALGGKTVYTSTNFDLLDGKWFFAQPGYTGPVDRVRILSSINPDSFFMDDITFTTVVPEPSSLALVVVGVAALACSRRVRHRRKGPKGEFPSAHLHD